MGKASPTSAAAAAAPVVHYPFWFGGSASCMAACITHPLDLVKVRLQTIPKSASGSKPSMMRVMINIIKHEGLPGLYSGLSASVLRQATYSTTRFGVYEEMKNYFAPGQSKPGFLSLVFMASTSGVIGGIAGNPADIINVRMQQDRANPPEKRRNYKNAIDGLIRMTKKEGVGSLFRGVGPNTMRAALMTASQLATYDQFKAVLLSSGLFTEGLTTHFTASTLAGLVATTVCSPVDVIKTRVMASHDKQGIVHLLKEITKHEGLLWAFRGWVPSFIRLGPQTILTFIAVENHRKIYRWWKEYEGASLAA